MRERQCLGSFQSHVTSTQPPVQNLLHTHLESLVSASLSPLVDALIWLCLVSLEQLLVQQAREGKGSEEEWQAHSGSLKVGH